MIVLYVALTLIVYSLYWIYQLAHGRTGPQVFEENKRLSVENERLRNEVERLKKKK